jgi:transcription elongation GreA/GreB family factor
MTRETLLLHLRATLRRQLDDGAAEVAATRASFASDTKSSAGDKHEVGRAMIQQELDKLEARQERLEAQLRELDRIPEQASTAQVAHGSVVNTDQGSYFIAIGLGAITVGDQRCFVCSPASPIGQALLGKTVGDQLHFNGRALRILGIG